MRKSPFILVRNFPYHNTHPSQYSRVLQLIFLSCRNQAKFANVDAIKNQTLAKHITSLFTKIGSPLASYFIFSSIFVNINGNSSSRLTFKTYWNSSYKIRSASLKKRSSERYKCFPSASRSCL